jgi:hypothetical protein
MPLTDDQLRSEIHTERQKLTVAVASLRGELQKAKRRAPAVAAAAVALVTTVRVVSRRLRRR